MLIDDRIRTESYLRFILLNSEQYFRDKIVLDVGTGSGILAMFAVRAGAKHVYGVEASMEIYAAAQESIRLVFFETHFDLLLLYF